MWLTALGNTHLSPVIPRAHPGWVRHIHSVHRICKVSVKRPSGCRQTLAACDRSGGSNVSARPVWPQVLAGRHSFHHRVSALLFLHLSVDVRLNSTNRPSGPHALTRRLARQLVGLVLLNALLQRGLSVRLTAKRVKHLLLFRRQRTRRGLDRCRCDLLALRNRIQRWQQSCVLTHLHHLLCGVGGHGLARRQQWVRQHRCYTCRRLKNRTARRRHHAILLHQVLNVLRPANRIVAMQVQMKFFWQHITGRVNAAQTRIDQVHRCAHRARHQATVRHVGHSTWLIHRAHVLLGLVHQARACTLCRLDHFV